MTYNIDIINLCINHYANNIKISKIASILNISIMNIYLWIKKYNYFFLNNIQLTKEDYYKIKNFKPHRSSKIYLYETQICDYVNNNNGCTLNDIIFNIPNINISKSSICNILKKNKISRKKINNRIIIKNYDELEKIRINFINNITDDFFLNVIAIDESSFCVNDHNRYGYSKKGCEIKKTIKHKRYKARLTLLSAINKDGFVQNKLIEGSVDSNIYLSFIKDNLENFKNKCILHDNARIHHTKILKEFCCNNNIQLLYIPPYTPEFNPIELIFSILKTHFRKLKHNNLIEDIYNTLTEVKKESFLKCYTHVISVFNKYKN